MKALVAGVVLLVPVFSSGGCLSEESNQGRPPMRVKTIAELMMRTPKLLNREIEMEGVFIGYKQGDAKFPEAARTASITRSDWLMRTGSDCLYVTGGAPKGADPLDAATIGRKVRITAKLANDGKGKLYLKFKKGSWLPVAAPSHASEPKPTGVGGAPAPPPYPDPAASISIAAICSEPGSYLGKTVFVAGVFRGFRFEGARFPVAARRVSITRSDWLIRTGEDHMIVTGGAPHDLDLFDPAALDKRIHIRARVEKDSEGRLFLRFLSS
jgi:hypothetical protein